ncbi:energy transducer TonB [Erythrobacter sp. MTPC3]|uniref:energy transducer TonB n=1 Tax=Erythrobacter sp. MTPC3 TaxID=3056564 RepID=UPI0036F344B6
MITMSKTVSAAALAATASLTFAAPAFAGEPKEQTSIVVRSAAAMEKWQDETTKDLNRALGHAPIRQTMVPNEGIVEVAFTLGADGRAENVEVLKGKGNWAARKAATYAVTRLRSLSDVPVSAPKDVRFIASIIFADDRAAHRKLAEQVQQKRAAQRFAYAEGETNVILLGG